MQKFYRLFVFALLLILFTGCSQSNEKFVVSDEFHSTDKSEELKNELQKEKYVDRAIAIFVDHELLVGVQLNPLQKWRKARIGKELQKKYEQKYPQYDVLVSTDYKIYLELTKINKKHDGQLAEKIKELKSLSKETT